MQNRTLAFGQGILRTHLAYHSSRSRPDQSAPRCRLCRASTLAPFSRVYTYSRRTTRVRHTLANSLMTHSTFETVRLDRLADLIAADWGHRVNYAALPYLQAMQCLRSIGDHYGADPGSTVVAYFLANANTWRGEQARAIKSELRRRLEERAS